MTIPSLSAASPPTALAGPGMTGAPAGPSDKGLGWLLEDFRGQVPGITGAFLVSRDGLVVAAAGLATDEADTAAALAASLYSVGGAAGRITSSPAGNVQQIIVQHDGQILILMNTPDQHPDASVQAAAGPGTAGPDGTAAVGCVLGVLTEPDVQTGLVSHGMTMLIESVARHMVTATRTTGDAAAAPEASGDGAGLRSEDCGDEQ